MDVIWNLTKACPWDCEICSVSAIHVCPTIEESVYSGEKDSKKELTLYEKLSVLRILVNNNFEIDFSGGDPLYYDEDLRVVEQATRWLPKSKIVISMTGSKITSSKINLLKKVSIVEFTVDNFLDGKNPFRPRGYNRASFLAMKMCVESGVSVRAVTVLYSYTISKTNLRNIYNWLSENGVLEWELLRFYPVGRASRFLKLIPSYSKYLEMMEFLCKLNGSTKIFFQHSLNMLEKNGTCPAIKESIGILPGGEVVLCPWAMDCNTKPLKGFELGKLPDDDLDGIISKAGSRLRCLGDGRCCRVLNYLERLKKEGE